MQSFKHSLVALILLTIPGSLFANFITDVTHKRFTRVAVERNVITIFERNDNHDAVNLLDPGLAHASESIVLGEPDHDFINHHGHGVAFPDP